MPFYYHSNQDQKGVLVDMWGMVDTDRSVRVVRVKDAAGEVAYQKVEENNATMYDTLQRKKAEDMLKLQCGKAEFEQQLAKADEFIKGTQGAKLEEE